MHRLRPARPCRGDNRADVEVALVRRGRPNWPRFVGLGDKERVPVGLGVDRDRDDPQPARGADHSAGDLAAVGDQDLRKHAHIRNTPKCVGSPGTPEIGALRAAEIAKASTMRVSAGSITPSSHSRALA